MKTEHTHGPWKVLEHARGRGRTCVTTANGAPVPAVICEIDTKSVGTNDEIRLANARLIAAAPELLAALRELCADKYLSDPINLERMKNARDAIFKAEGNA